MGNISKAIGAAVGGAATATAAIPFVPDGAPWYAYPIMYAVAVILPAFLTYRFPANKP